MSMYAESCTQQSALISSYRY